MHILSNSSLSPKLRLGVDFVFPLSQEQQEQEQLPHQNLNEDVLDQAVDSGTRVAPEMMEECESGDVELGF